MFQSVFSLGSALLISILGLLVAHKSAHETIRRWFFGFCLSLSLWQASLWLSNLQTVQALLFNRLTFAGPVLAEGFLLIFINHLGEDRQQSESRTQSTATRVGIIAAVLGVVISIVPGGVVDVILPHYSSTGVFIGYNVGHGQLYILYVLLLLLVAVIMTEKLIILSRSRDPIRKQQARYVAAGIVSAVIFGVFTNIVLPLLLGTSEYSYLGSVSVLLLVGILSVAIVRYKLIDVQFVVVRSLTYTTLIILLAAIYAGIVFVLATFVFQIHVSFKTEAVFAFPAALIGLTFGSIKKVFAYKTDRLFFQDIYDPQAFLDQLNKALVSNVELERLLSVCAEIIAGNLRAEFCLFGIKEDGFKGVRILGTTKKTFNEDDIAYARRSTPHLKMAVIVADFLPPGSHKLKSILNRNGIAALVRLVPEFSNNHEGAEGLGYIMLGQKRSGSAYSSQDVKIMSIIANELVIAIQNALHFEEIQRFNVTLQDRINHATRELRQTNQKLIEMDETKDDFISMASHQLRTPLTSVKGYLSMVLEGDAGQLNNKQGKMLRQAFSSSQRMVYLITDLLNISRLRTGKFIIEAAPADLSEIAREEVAQLHETAALKDIELTYQKPATFPKLMLDETKTRQVIMNFIDNAIYYTPTGGHIRVELEERPATVELRVIDDGMGVPKSEQHHLFTKFYRAGNARKARPDGTGLGLFMAKKVISGQGGSIVFSSEENHGSTFGFVLSKHRLQVTKEAIAKAKQTYASTK